METGILIYGMSENRGGVERYILNCVKALEKTQYHVYVMKVIGKKLPFEEEIVKSGAKILCLPISIKDPIFLFKEWKQKLSLYNIQIAYLNLCTLENLRIFNILKHFRIKNIIVHAHSSGLEENYSINVQKKLVRNYKKVKNYGCKMLACSKEAGEWMFGKKEKFAVIKNCIELSDYEFSEAIRQLKRQELGITSDFVLGTVGRLCDIKNSKRIVEIFFEFHNLYRNSKLIIVGDGPDKEIIIQKIKELGIEEQVLLIGVQENVSAYLQAFDYFILPSKKEGFSFALLEAQATGLRCITSFGKVPKMVNVTGNVKYKSLQDDNLSWAKEIFRAANDISYIREDKTKEIETAGYSLKSMQDNLVNILNMSNSF